jgi:uncharacterized damage-inducible protein DinB
MSAKQALLNTYDFEHATTMKVLRAYPADKLDLKPHPKLKSARELGWMFALDYYLGRKVWHDELANGLSGSPPPPPDDWNTVIEKVEKGHREFRSLIEKASDEDLRGDVHFMTGPKTMGPMSRSTFAWFLLHDQIHHRGQFSVYLRLADGKVPSIYGPTADEPWI